MIYAAICVRTDTLQSRRRNIASGVKRHFLLIVLITIDYLKHQTLTKRYQPASIQIYPSLFSKLNSTVMIMAIFLSSIVRHMTLFVVKDVLPLVIENVKTLLLLRIYVSSTALDNIEQTLQDVGSNLETVIADRQKNLVEFKKPKNNISRIVKEKREEILNFVDKLERKMLDTISVIESETRQQVEQLIEELGTKQQEVNTLKKDIELTKKICIQCPDTHGYQTTSGTSIIT